MANLSYLEEGAAMQGKCYPNSVYHPLKPSLIFTLCEALP